MKSQKLLTLLNHRLRIQTQDGKTIVGQMIAFDKHMNIVLADCEEFRTSKSKPKTKRSTSDSTSPHQELYERRTMGLVVLRGEVIVSIVVESGSPPEPSTSTKKRQSASTVLTGTASNFPFKGQTVAPQLIPFSGAAQQMMRPGMPMMPPMMPGMPGNLPNIPGIPYPTVMPSGVPGMMFPGPVPNAFPPNIPGMMPPPPPAKS